jgi:uncharacterized protein YkwD
LRPFFSWKTAGGPDDFAGENLARMKRSTIQKLLSTAILSAISVGCQEQSLPLPSGMFGKPQAAPRAAVGDACADPANRGQFIAQMISAVNEQRAKRGVAPLRLNTDLVHLADFYACRLVEGGFFSHEDPFDGSSVDSRASDFGYAFWKIGENLAAGQQSVDDAVAELMLSPLHRANMLDPAFTEIGVSVKIGGEMGIYWVQEFGRPVSEQPIAPSSQPAIAPAPLSQPAPTPESPSSAKPSKSPTTRSN